jgi:hypothetical protein
VLTERLLAGYERLGSRRSVHPDVIVILGHEALEVASVVGVELALDRTFGTHGTSRS